MNSFSHVAVYLHSVLVCLSSAGGKSSTPMYRNLKGRILETPCVEGDDSLLREEMLVPICSELRKKGPVLFLPTIEHLTDKEFETVPK